MSTGVVQTILARNVDRTLTHTLLPTHHWQMMMCLSEKRLQRRKKVCVTLPRRRMVIAVRPVLDTKAPILCFLRNRPQATPTCQTLALRVSTDNLLAFQLYLPLKILCRQPEFRLFVSRPLQRQQRVHKVIHTLLRTRLHSLLRITTSRFGIPLEQHGQIRIDRRHLSGLSYLRWIQVLRDSARAPSTRCLVDLTHFRHMFQADLGLALRRRRPPAALVPRGLITTIHRFQPWLLPITRHSHPLRGT